MVVVLRTKISFSGYVKQYSCILLQQQIFQWPGRLDIRLKLLISSPQIRKFRTTQVVIDL